MSKRLQTIFVSLAFLLSLALVVQSQEQNRRLTRKAISYGFVSPNTQENLKLEEAVKNLNSAEEVRLLYETQTVACRVRAQSRINKSLGDWADGAEHSMIFRLYSDESTIRYAVAALGKRWRQKTVLYFRRQTGGTARMYLIPIQQRHRGFNFVARTVAKALDDAGVSYRTLVPLKTRLLVYVVDLSNELQPQVRKAAHQLRARSLAFTGTGAFIGNDNDRDQAQEIFEQEIKHYEAHHSLNQRCRNANLTGPKPR